MIRPAAAALLACGGAAGAGELEFGLGYDDVLGRSGSGTAAIELQVRSDPRVTLGPFGFGLGAAAEADTHGDLWAGAGVTAVLPLGAGAGFRLDGSLMAGVYAVGDGGNDLGSSLEFRSRLGVSRGLGERWRLGLAVEHKSNGGIGDFNPGVETAFLTVARRF